ncbi:hypothetical protein BDN70DRAFT_79759 [Pholiota conissans]|uniref:BTB domain-containing protein n=1 Tax=Pholiota conissans TaxID=109636 RepID=A0A9P5YY32_9AGAR|nr:hypothetical protein BDN70DRAFT_79759 [Pholiota conissans]
MAAATASSSYSHDEGASFGSPISASCAPKTRDPDFYFDSRLVVFEIEKRLFRVPTHLLVKESEILRDLFELPQGSTNSEGTSADNPIILHDIKHEEFRSLLKILYPTSIQKTVVLVKQEWLSILKLSTMWFMANLKNMAVSELEANGSLAPVEKVVWGRKCHVSSWVLDGYSDLVSKNDTLSDAEVDATGHMTAIKLFRIREGKLRGQFYDPKAEIQQVFADELASV